MDVLLGKKFHVYNLFILNEITDNAYQIRQTVQSQYSQAVSAALSVFSMSGSHTCLAQNLICPCPASLEVLYY